MALPTAIFVLYACLATAHAISIGVIVPANGPTKRISRIVSDAVSTNTAENVEVVWIRARSASTAGTVIEQWSKYKFVALIGSMGRCATQLELAASLNLTAFTWNCQRNETFQLQSDSELYWSHVRLDKTVMSLVPHIASLYTNPQLLARDTWSKSSLASPAVQHITLTSTSVLDEDVTKLLARRLKDLGISCDWCSTSCNHSTAGSILVVYSRPSFVHLWLQGELYNQRDWMAVIVVTDEPLTSLETIDWNFFGVSEFINKLFLIQPTPSSSSTPSPQELPNDEVAYHDSVALFLAARNQSVTRAKSALYDTSYGHTKAIINHLRSSCYTSLSGERKCFDNNNWDVGRFSFYRYFTKSDIQHLPEYCTALQTNNVQNTQNITASNFQLQGDFVKADGTDLFQLNTEALKKCTESYTEATILYPVTTTPVTKMAALGALIVLCAILLLILLMGMVIFIYYKLTHYKRGRKFSPAWLISSSDITAFRNQTDCESGDRIFTQDMESMLEMNGCPALTDFGYYRDQPVALKRWCSNGILLIKSVNKDLELMVGLHHENLATFYGVCSSPSEFMLVTEYCIKGSLEEMLLYEHVNLDETFSASLLSDIIKGMTFIHKSSIHYHGNLKSSNCLVTARWMVKLSDFGLSHVRSLFKTERDLLWCAPEVIRHKEVASQKADVYSFGIILYELIGKSGPFGAGYQYSDKDLQVLVNKIIDTNYIPETSWLCCEDYLKNTMISCWQNPSKLRPDFNSLNDHLKPFKAVLNGRSMVDNILTIMEKYQMTLEDRVEERNSQLLAEKKKTENLLHRMLPPLWYDSGQIAEQLIKGKPVDPESFSCITVCFSDICGFTNLASSSTPIQVISLLNDLYTMFDIITRHYDVYKVETVGDAYLCVSGLPNLNGDQHASEIALMALEFMKTLHSFKSDHNLLPDHKLKMRIGINSGPCVAGVVGVSMPRYTLFGDTVNVASRLETTSEPMKIQIGNTTKELLDKVGGFYCEKRGYVHLKGKGDMETYWLTGAVRSAGNILPGRCSTNLDSLDIPGKSNTNITSSIISDLDMLSSSELSPSYRGHRRTGSMKSVVAMQLADSFRRGERSKSVSRSIERSMENLFSGSAAESIPRASNNNERTTLLPQANSVINHQIAIKVDRC